jgi:hypothetical protein
MTERAVNAPYATEAHASVFRNADFFSLIFLLLVMCSSRYHTIRTNQAKVPRYGGEEEADHLYRQMLTEMQAADFCGMWHYMTIWGTKP